MISVIIPTYNRENVILESVQSVLNQTYKNIEVIVVDDNSNDGTHEIIKKINDNRLRYYRLDRNFGANYARNFGIKKSKGNYIAFQDSDDIWYNTKLEKQIFLLNSLPSEYAMVFCSLKKDYGKDRIIPVKKNKIYDGYLFKELKFQNFISTQTILCEKSAIDKIGGFDNSLPALQDWDFVLKISKLYKIAHLKEVLVDLRISKNSITKNHSRVLDAMYLLFDKYNNDLSKTELKKWYYNASFNAVKSNRVKEARKLFLASINFRSICFDFASFATANKSTSFRRGFEGDSK